MKKPIYCLLVVIAVIIGSAKAQEIPAVYSNLKYNDSGQLVFLNKGTEYPAKDFSAEYELSKLKSAVEGDSNGLNFNFSTPYLNGTLYYGFIHFNDSKHPLPVYFKRYASIDSGLAYIDIRNQLGGRYDMIDWEGKGHGTIGYRIVTNSGHMVYEGRVAFQDNGVFSEINTIIEGPFVDQVKPNSAIISFETRFEGNYEVQLGNRKYSKVGNAKLHEIICDGLEPSTTYSYSIDVDGIERSFSFVTAPEVGSREPFCFAYASDSRGGQGGGERNMHGANYYIMRRIAALAYQQDARFMHFSGDLINGYLTSKEETNLQYANWKRAVEPWGHYMPIYEGMGNHEALGFSFPLPNSRFGVMIDRFPFETESAEACFAQNFVNPVNGPKSEDGAVYDPNPKKMDFPSYEENVFYYTFGNIAMINLNSDYWYAPSLAGVIQTSGNLHAYIMDVQLEWLAETLKKFEEDENVDHVFVTQHTPAFPNGGHVSDDMWYNGKNEYRPTVAGKRLAKGIIERRDEYLDLLVNKSSKVRAIFTGDEHNYNRLVISPDMPRYPEMYFAEKKELSRTIYQINNGAAGAPYYAQQETPWSEYVSGFTTQNALVLVHVYGGKVEIEVLNPDTLEEVDRAVLIE